MAAISSNSIQFQITEYASDFQPNENQGVILLEDKPFVVTLTPASNLTVREAKIEALKTLVLSPKPELDADEQAVYDYELGGNDEEVLLDMPAVPTRALPQYSTPVPSFSYRGSVALGNIRTSKTADEAMKHLATLSAIRGEAKASQAEESKEMDSSLASRMASLRDNPQLTKVLDSRSSAVKWEGLEPMRRQVAAQARAQVRLAAPTQKKQVNVADLETKKQSLRAEFDQLEQTHKTSSSDQKLGIAKKMQTIFTTMQELNKAILAAKTPSNRR